MTRGPLSPAERVKLAADAAALRRHWAYLDLAETELDRIDPRVENLDGILTERFRLMRAQMNIRTAFTLVQKALGHDD